ncbi:hypothetical protein A9Q84_02400 [Halobacteriovorax marinus]|uniref:Lipoprotein n=1 Tax=Halobacteriovorax marinus TaxID=97084 RepID=A0A1Y5FCZ4_9BACT|nr:hypothetical protein A9Q84_02400 [Halobacteriovorax marinus]
MRNFLFILILLLCANSFAVDTNPIKSVSAIEELSWALESSRWDYEQSMVISFDERSPISELNCERSDHSELVLLFNNAISRYRNYFPDEDLPYVSALTELKRILTGKVLEYCLIQEADQKVWQVYLDSDFLVSIEQ